MRRKRVMWTTVLGWSLATGAFEAFRIRTLFSGPPSEDLCANDLGFQLVVSAYFVLIRWLPLLGALLLAELGVFVLVSRTRSI